MPERIVTCRVLNRNGNQCTGEAVDETAELLICTRHLAEAQRLIHGAFQRAQRKRSA
jgi:hypothetical protein